MKSNPQQGIQVTDFFMGRDDGLPTLHGIAGTFNQLYGIHHNPAIYNQAVNYSGTEYLVTAMVNSFMDKVEKTVPGSFTHFADQG